MRDKIEIFQEDFDAFIAREKHLGVMIHERVKRWGAGKTAVQHKPCGQWIAYSWADFGRMIDDTARALLAHNVTVGEMVGIFASNRVEWSVADLAALSIRAVSVPIYATNSAQEAGYIIDDARIRILFAGNREQYEKACEARRDSQHLKLIVTFDKDIELLDGDLHLDDFMELDRAGRQQQDLDKRLAEAEAGDLATLIYTSGTTGEPKGAMLTHKNLISMSYDAEELVPLGENDVNLAFLPLSHVFERSWTYFVFIRSGENHYCHDTGQLREFLQESRPMFMCSVPRMWEKIHATIMNGLEDASPAKQKLFHWALNVGGQVGYRKRDGKAVPPLLALKFFLADNLVLKKIRDLFGGRNVFFNCGGAAFSAEISEFFFKAGVYILQGYGLTECFCPCIANTKHNKFGTCGPVMPMYEVRIAENGEIQVDGPGKMLGYYNKPELTKEIFTEDGWIKTGDVGFLDEENYLTVTDRIKDLMKTSGGKYIAPQMIETILNEDFYIEQSATIGDGRKFVSALIVPCFESLEKYAKDHNIPFGSHEDLVKHPDIISFFRSRIDDLTEHLGRVEKIKKFVLLAQEFSQEAREITPTQKLRRKTITDRYKDIIEKMYHE